VRGNLGGKLAPLPLAQRRAKSLKGELRGLRARGNLGGKLKGDLTGELRKRLREKLRGKLRGLTERKAES
jgi:hypothetical protein